MPSDSEEDRWIAEQRTLVEEYLKRQRLDHRGVARYPTFHVYPILALWAVQSRVKPGSAGWWAISGDLPTDYISRPPVAAPREALRLFSQQWREIADYMKRGKPHPHATIGPPEKWAELAPLLRSRAEAMQFLIEDDDLWERPSSLE